VQFKGHTLTQMKVVVNNRVGTIKQKLYHNCMCWCTCFGYNQLYTYRLCI